MRVNRRDTEFNRRSEAKLPEVKRRSLADAGDDNNVAGPAMSSLRLARKATKRLVARVGGALIQ
jgi:hypothetical protein